MHSGNSSDVERNTDTILFQRHYLARPKLDVPSKKTVYNLFYKDIQKKKKS